MSGSIASSHEDRYTGSVKIRLVAALTLSSCLIGQAATSYTVEGLCEFSKVYGKERMFTRYSLSKFTFTSKECEWAIKAVPIESKLHGVGEQGAAFDGTEVYTLLSYEKLIEERRKNGDKLPNNVAAGLVGNRSKFLRSSFFPIAGPIWLALGSQCYFQDNRGSEIDVVDSWLGSPIKSSDIVDVRRKGRWELLENGGLPSRVEYYEEGITNVVYRAIVSTNFQGATIPLETTHQGFSFKDGNAELISEVKITITNVGPCDLEHLGPPDLPGPISVKDARHRDLEHLIRFLWTDVSHWPTVEEVQKLPAYSDERRRTKEIAKDNSEKKAMKIIFPMACLVVLVGIGFVAWKGRRSE